MFEIVYDFPSFVFIAFIVNGNIADKKVLNVANNGVIPIIKKGVTIINGKNIMHNIIINHVFILNKLPITDVKLAFLKKMDKLTIHK